MRDYSPLLLTWVGGFPCIAESLGLEAIFLAGDVRANKGAANGQLTGLTKGGERV
jgi:hypothetical protein